MVLAACFLLVAPSCNWAEQARDGSSQAGAASASRLEPGARSKMLASAERFENLTEAAFAADPGETEKRLFLARREAQAALPSLDSPTSRRFASLDVRLSNAFGTGNPVDVSLAANELYRLFIAAAHGEGHIPLEIGLLDYAGFRYWAGARDQPPRWADMAEAHSFAEGQWQAVRSRIGDPKVVAGFDSVLAALGQAVEDKDPRAAAAAAKSELDQVDVLEMSVS